MVEQILDRMFLLSLLEASQSAVESSDQALKAAEEAFSAAQTANKKANEVLRAVTKAFVQENSKQQVSSNLEGLCQEIKENDATRVSIMECDKNGDSEETDECFLSTNKNPVHDLTDDDTTEYEESSCHEYIVVSSTGPAADHCGVMLGIYRKTEEMREGRSVYVQEHDREYGGISYRLFSVQGLWIIGLKYGDWLLRAVTLSESPTATVKWKCYNTDIGTWLIDPELTVTNLSEKPSDCEITISISEDIERDIKEPGVAGVYRAVGSYCQGRPVFQHLGGRFKLSVVFSCWRVSCGVGDHIHMSQVSSGSVPSLCPADPRAARNGRWGRTHWGYQHPMGHTESMGITLKCNKHKH